LLLHKQHQNKKDKFIKILTFRKNNFVKKRRFHQGERKNQLNREIFAKYLIFVISGIRMVETWNLSYFKINNSLILCKTELYSVVFNFSFFF
jgi:hypothetical protein